MASLTATITLLLSLLGIIPFEEGHKAYLQDVVITEELGIDPSCPDCNVDQLKLQYVKYSEDKDGGILIDVLAGG